MDTASFDTLAASFATVSSRRRVLGGLAALVAGAAVAVPAAAKKGKGKGNRKGKGKGKGNNKAKNRGFTVTSRHEVTEAATTGCNDENGPSGGKCTTRFGGTGNASHLGLVAYESSFTSDWSQVFSNDEGNLCAPVNGVVTLTREQGKKGKGSVVLTVEGSVCQSNANPGYPLLLDGVYEVTGGTGAFKGATGEGTASGSVAGSGAGAVADFEANGKITF